MSYRLARHVNGPLRPCESTPTAGLAPCVRGACADWLNECTFRGGRFNVSTHTDAAFLNCAFVSCSFFDTTFERCKMVGSMFDRCAFNLLKVIGGNWSFVGLPGADLSSAELKYAIITIDQAIVLATALGGDVRVREPTTYSATRIPQPPVPSPERQVPPLS